MQAHSRPKGSRDFNAPLCSHIKVALPKPPPTSLKNAPRAFPQTPRATSFQECTTCTPVTSHPHSTRDQEPFHQTTVPLTHARISPDTLPTRLHPCAFSKLSKASHSPQSSMLLALPSFRGVGATPARLSQASLLQKRERLHVFIQPIRENPSIS